jgi:signal transduction histidine kinase
MNRAERRDFADNQLFQGIAPELLDEILDIPRRVTFRENEVIFSEGDPADCLYLIASGSVELSRLARARQETLVYLGPGEYFGDLALFDPAPRSTQARAAQLTVLGRIDQRGWDRLLELAAPQINRNLLVTGARRLRRADTHWLERLLQAERLSLLGSAMSGVMHDLKDPMNVVMGAADTIRIRSPDPEVRRLVDIIFKHLNRMTALAREVTDYARGEWSLKRRWIQIDLFMTELREASLQRLSAYAIQVDCEVSFDGQLYIDPERMLRALGNVIRNAAEAMPGGGTLRIVAERIDGDIQIAVQDTGTGIPADILPSIFDPFVTSGKASGTGLGLAITKSIIEAHGGTITVASTAGAGTTFTIRLPAGLT